MNVPWAAPGVFRKLSLFLPPPSVPFFKQKQHGVSELQSDPEEGLCWVRRGERVRGKKARGKVKGALCRLAGRCRSNLGTSSWWERPPPHRYLATASVRPPWEKLLLLAGNCGSSTEPSEYIVSIRARYPIGGVNRGGIPLSQLPQQRRKERGAELVGGEVK